MHRSYLFVILFGLTLVLTLCPNLVEAKSFELKTTRVSVDVPTGWMHVQGFFGSDLSLLAPEGKPGESRTTISIYDAESNLEKFPVDAALKSKNEFFQGRKDWINSQANARYLNQISSKSLSNGLELAFEYQLEGQKFREYSFYLACSGHFLFIKGLVSEKNFNSSEEQILKKIPAAIECQKNIDPKSPTALNSQQLNSLVNKLNNQNSALKTIDSLREFILKHDESFENEDEANLNAQNNFSNSNLIQKFFAIPLLIQRAQAQKIYQEGNQCIFAGWVSTFTKKSNGKLTCQHPKVTAKNYSASSCGSSAFQCNPILFGPDVCIQNKFAGSTATARCNLQRKSDQEILNYAQKNSEELRNLVNSTNKLCSNASYLKNNPELCESLIDQLKTVVEDDGTPTVQNAEKAFDNYLKNKTVSPDNYDAASKQLQNQMKLFEQVCMTGENSFKSGTVGISNANGAVISQMNCDAERKAIANNLEKLKKVEDKIGLKSTASSKCSTGANSNIKNQGVVLNKALVNLTCEGKNPKLNLKSLSHCAQDINCAVAQAIPVIGSSSLKLLEKVAGKSFKNSAFGKNCTGNDSCITQAASAIIKGLWSTLKGLFDLGKLAKDYVVSKATDAWNWATGSSVENESSKRIQAMSKQMNSSFEEFKKDPFGFLGNMFKGIMNGITEFMTHDVFCMKWQGLPRSSKCEKPLPSLGCMDCKTLINGSCAAIGYVAEKIGETFAGSWIAGAAGGVAKNMSLGITKMLTQSAKAGKLAKVEASMMKAMPKLTEAVKASAKVTAKLADDAAELAGKSFSKVQSGLKYLGKNTVGESLTKIKNLKAVKMVSNSQAVAKIGNIEKQFSSLNQKAFEHGFSSSMKVKMPKMSLAKAATKADEVDELFGVFKKNTTAPTNSIVTSKESVTVKKNNYVKDDNGNIVKDKFGNSRMETQEYAALKVSSMDNSKLTRNAASVKEKLNVEMLYSQEMNGLANGFSSKSMPVKSVDGLYENKKVIGVDTKSVQSGQVTTTIRHEIDHAVLDHKLSHNITDPLAIQFYPKKLDSDWYSTYYRADESRTWSRNFYESLRGKKESDVLALFKGQEKVPANKLFGTPGSKFSDTMDKAKSNFDSVITLNNRSNLYLSQAEKQIEKAPFRAVQTNNGIASFEMDISNGTGVYVGPNTYAKLNAITDEVERTKEIKRILIKDIEGNPKLSSTNKAESIKIVNDYNSSIKIQDSPHGKLIEVSDVSNTIKVPLTPKAKEIYLKLNTEAERAAFRKQYTNEYLINAKNAILEQNAHLKKIQGDMYRLNNRELLSKEEYLRIKGDLIKTHSIMKNRGWDDSKRLQAPP